MTSATEALRRSVRVRIGAPWIAIGAAVLATVSIGSALAAIAVHSYVQDHTDAVVHLSATDVVLATAYPLVAAVILVYQPGNLVGRLLLVTALMGPYLLAGQYAALTLVPGQHVPAAGVATWVSVWAYAPYFVLWGLVPLHFPDGSLPSPRWRPVRRAVVAMLAAHVVARMFAPVTSDAVPSLHNPLGSSDTEVLNVITLISAMALLLGAGSLGVAAVVTRLRAARDGVERARLQWLVLGVAGLIGCTALSLPWGGRVGDAGLGLGLVVLVGCIAIAAVRHQLFDIGTALRRTVLYAFVTALLLVAYVAAVAGAGALAPGRRIAYAVVAVVALIAAAARDQIQRVVDRVLFGHRHDPGAVLSRIRRRLDLATGPLDAAAQLADGLRAGLQLPYVRVESADERLDWVESGEPVAALERIPVRDQGEDLGTLVVARRHPDERFAPTERAAIDEVAERTGPLLRAASLLHDLQRSRESLVSAREEERRRLRRDLHDSIGPQLAGIAMQLESLAGSLSGDQAARAERLRDQLRSAVADVRHVVEDLRPPALDELGLLGALRSFATQFGDTVTLQVPESVPALSAATEVAAYRIAAEAVTNAVRHSGSDRCALSVRTDDDWLVVEVADHGTGIDPAARPGVGLQSIRDRASEVGGRLEVTDNPGGGTLVTARLPLAAS